MSISTAGFDEGSLRGFSRRVRLRLPPRVLLRLLAGPVLHALAGCATPGVRNTARTFDTVVIDAGHGGVDSGAIARSGLREKEATLDVARRVRHRLESAGLRTVMVRDSDRFVPLQTRTAISNRERNAVFLSIHFNHTRSRRVQGAETYYYHPYARGLADRIHFHLTRSRPAVDRGVKRAAFRVLRDNLNPAVLVECGFLSNGHEARLASTGSHRDRIAEVLAHALVEHRWPDRPQPEPAAAYPAARSSGR